MIVIMIGAAFAQEKSGIDMQNSAELYHGDHPLPYADMVERE
jgi:hypothetical protein